MLAQSFRESCRRHEERIAIVDGDRRLTYGDLLRTAAAYQCWLRDEAAVKSGDVVAAALGNSWQFAAAFFASASLGAVIVPCNPQWHGRENQWLAARLKPRVVLLEAGSEREWESCGVRLLSPPVDLSSDDGQNCASVSDDEVAAYLTTSGSTGTPRIVPRSGRNLVEGAANLARTLEIGPGRRFLSVVPFHHSNGLHNCLIAPLLHGATVITMRNFTPQGCADLIGREAANVLVGSPFLFGLLAGRVRDMELLSSLELCISAGARMPEPTAAQWRERTGKRIRQLYGSTETGTIAIDYDAEERGGENGGVFVGKAIPGVEIRTIDGEILVRSSRVMCGYLGEPNDAYFHEGFFRMGDSGYITSDGGVYLTGRIRRVINIAGVKVDPVEVERVVEEMPGVSACYADAVEGAHGASAIRVRIALIPAAAVSRDAVIEHCRGKLAEYKLPRIIELNSELPANLSGKILKGWNN